jgi:TRAP-type transport system periplasmic protein
MRLFTRVMLAATLATTFAAMPLQAQTQHKLTIASGQPPVFPYISLLRDYFVPEIDKRLASTGHRIQWTQGYAGTIMKVGSEVESVKDGLVDIGFVLLPNNESKLPLHSYTYFAPFSSTDPGVTVSAFNKTQKAVAAMGDAWDRNNHVYLAAAVIESYNLYAKKPIRKVEDLKGMKIGVIGPNANWLRNTGAVSVTLNLGSIYNDLQSGIYDAALLADSVAASLKIQEVGPYRIQFDLGSVVFAALTINKDRWNSLPPEVRNTIMAVARDYEREVTRQMSQRGKEGVEAMLKNGLTNIDPGREGRAAWANLMPNIAQEWSAARREKSPASVAVIPTFMKAIQEEGMKPLRNWTGN